MTEENSTENKEKNRHEASDQKHVKRKILNPYVRYLIIASWGMILAVSVFYLLKELGY